MNKQDFLKELRRRLSVLDPGEVDELLREYEQHIDMEIANGKSEEQAIAGFGDFDEFVAEILSAYHVNPRYETYDANSTRLKHTLSEMGHFIQATFDALLSMNRNDIWRVVSRGFMLFILMVILRGIGSSVVYGGVRLLNRMPFLGDFAGGLLSLAWHLTFLAFSLFIAYYFIKRFILPPNYRTIDYELHRKKEERTMSRIEPDAFVADEQVHDDGSYAKKEKDRRSPRAERDGLSELFLIVLKVVLIIFFFIPAVLTLVGLIIGTGAALVFALMGYPIIGLTMIGIGATLITLAVVLFVWDLTFRATATTPAEEVQS